MVENHVVLLRTEDGRALVRKKCEAAGLEFTILWWLIEAELKQVGKMRKRGISSDFDEIFGLSESEEN